jgi:hypothetical protein
MRPSQSKHSVHAGEYKIDFFEPTNLRYLVGSISFNDDVEALQLIPRHQRALTQRHWKP